MHAHNGSISSGRFIRIAAMICGAWWLAGAVVLVLSFVLSFCLSFWSLFVCWGPLLFEVCVFVAGWRHALRSEWPLIIFITLIVTTRGWMEPCRTSAPEGPGYSWTSSETGRIWRWTGSCGGGLPAGASLVGAHYRHHPT